MGVSGCGLPVREEKGGPRRGWRGCGLLVDDDDDELLATAVRGGVASENSRRRWRRMGGQEDPRGKFRF